MNKETAFRDTPEGTRQGEIRIIEQQKSVKRAERDSTEARSLAVFQADTIEDESRIISAFLFSSFQNPSLLAGAAVTLETYSICTQARIKKKLKCRKE